MPLFYRKDINHYTRLAVWKIEESESFFHMGIPLLREIKHPHKRLQHLAGRFLLPLLFPDFPAHEILVADTRKPYLPNDIFHFSISHCDNYAAAIVSKTNRVGIDVETITQKVIRVKHKFLHTNELAFIEALLPHEQLMMLNIAWNAKEAMYKWYSLGNVDFSEMLRIEPFTLHTEGTITSHIQIEKCVQKCLVHYHTTEDLSLAWLVE